MFRPPTHGNGKGPFVISWWCAHRHDEAEFCRSAFSTLAEAEEVLGWLSEDPANDNIRRNWLEPDIELIPF